MPRRSSTSGASLSRRASLRQAPANSRDGSRFVCELLPCDALPAIDFTATVSALLFSAQCNKVVTKLLQRGQNVIITMYCLSIVLLPIATIDPGGVWYPWLPSLVPVLQLPGLVSVICFVRTEMARLLVRQYEYWFFSAQNILFSVCLLHLLRDLRAVVVPLGSLMHQNSILVDAQVVHTKAIMYSAFLTAIAYVVLMVAVLL